MLILGTNTTNLISDYLLEQLTNCYIKFYLIGEKFFDNTHHSPRWDLFAKYTPETCQFLKSLRFKKTSILPYYDDPFVKSVFVHQAGNIYVQLLTTVDIKIYLQKRLLYLKKIYPKFTFLDGKTKTKKMWDVCIRLFDRKSKHID